MAAVPKPYTITTSLSRNEFQLAGATLFHEDWWLNAAARDKWDRVTVLRDGVIVASMPFVLRRRLALRFLTMPPYCRTLGPLLANIPAKPSDRLSDQVELLRSLLAKLPKHDRFEMILPPESGLTLAFVACSYMVTHTFTFTWDGTPPAEVLLQNMQQGTRRKILINSDKLHAERHMDIDRFIRMSMVEHGRYLRNQNDFETIKDIFQACAERKQGLVLSAVNKEGKDVAVSVLVWGRGVLYNWLAARHPEEAGPGANSFLVWEAMQVAREKGLIYDSDGVYAPHAAVFYSRFGLTPKVRPTVNLGNNWWKLAIMAKATLRPRSVDLYYRR